MKVLMVNGNRTQAVTDHCLRVARAVARPGIEFEGVTAHFGADIVTAEPENVLAAHAVLDLLAEHHARFDAAILAISFDSGLFAARDLVPILVIGMTEAALQAAAADGEPVGVVLFGEASLPLYEAHFARLPEGRAIRAIRVVKITSVATYLDADAQARAVLAEIAALEGEGIRHVVICGAAMAGLACPACTELPGATFRWDRGGCGEGAAPAGQHRACAAQSARSVEQRRGAESCLAGAILDASRQLRGTVRGKSGCRRGRWRYRRHHERRPHLSVFQNEPEIIGKVCAAAATQTRRQSATAAHTSLEQAECTPSPLNFISFHPLFLEMNDACAGWA